MRLLQQIVRVLAFFLSTNGLVLGQSVISPVVGFTRTTCPGGKDTVLSVPFHPPPKWAAFLGEGPQTIASGVSRLTFGVSPNFAPGELLTPSHFVFIGQGDATEGRHFSIVAHTETTIDIAAPIGELSDLSVGTKVVVLAGWTLDTLLPVATQAAIHPSSGNLASGRGSELLLFDSESSGTNAATARRFFIAANGWTEVGTYADAGSTSLKPGQLFVIRHRSGAADTFFVATQQVYDGVVSFPIFRDTDSPRDTLLGLPRPVPTKMADLDLESVVENSASTAPEHRVDEVRIFDRALQDGSRRPVAVYFRVAGEWRRDAVGFPLAGDDVIEPSAGLVIRKAPNPAGGAVLWSNSPRYNVLNP